MADHDDVMTFLAHLGHFHVHLGHQRAGGVEHVQATVGRLGAYGPRHAVRGEDHSGTVGYLVQFFDEHGALFAQVGDDIVVVDDLVAHIDGRAVQGQRPLDDGDGAVHPGAEATGLRQQYRLFTRWQLGIQQGFDIALEGTGPRRLAVQIDCVQFGFGHCSHTSAAGKTLAANPAGSYQGQGPFTDARRFHATAEFRAPPAASPRSGRPCRPAGG